MADVLTVPILVSKTYVEMEALIAAAELNPFLWYKISDRGDNGLVFRAAAPNRLENEGIRYMLCPATYATVVDDYDNDWIGVWNSTKQASATEGQLTIWNGLVWIAGAVLSGDSPDTEASGWTVIPKASFTNHEYIEMIFGVTYDFENDWINKQWDGNQNKIGFSKNLNDRNYNFNYNPVDVFDWNFISFPDALFFNNQMQYCKNVLVEGGIFYNNICESMENVIVNRLQDNTCAIYNVSKIQEVSGNTCLVIYDVIGIGAGLVSIMSNKNNGSITGTFDADVTDTVVDKIGTAD
jgi:hypothetical protein